MTAKSVVINGRFLSQAVTGVQRYAIELVVAIDRLISAGQISGDVAWRLLLPQDARFLDGLVHIKQEKVGKATGHRWEQTELPMHVGDGILFCPGNLAPFISLVTGKPVVVTVHDLSFRYFPSAYSVAFRAWYHLMTPLIMAFARKVITVSVAEKTSIEKIYPGTKARLVAIQNGSSFVGEAAPAENLLLPGRYILYVGSLSRRKNFHGFVAAGQVLLKEDPSLHAVVVGGSSAVFAGCGIDLDPSLKDRFHFLGQVNDVAVMTATYRAAGCLVFASHYEASPLPPLEAMAGGCPVISSTIPSLRERCGDAAVYCDANSTADISSKIREVLSWSAEQRAAFTGKAREHAAGFSWERCARETVEVLLEGK